MGFRDSLRYASSATCLPPGHLTLYPPPLCLRFAHLPLAIYIYISLILFISVRELITRPLSFAPVITGLNVRSLPNCSRCLVVEKSKMQSIKEGISFFLLLFHLLHLLLFLSFFSLLFYSFLFYHVLENASINRMGRSFSSSSFSFSLFLSPPVYYSKMHL